MSATMTQYLETPAGNRHVFADGGLGILTFDEATGATVLERVVEETWISPDALVQFDEVHQSRGTDERWDTVVRLETAYNPSFQPVVFASEPHVAVDLDRGYDVRVRRHVMSGTARHT